MKKLLFVSLLAFSLLVPNMGVEAQVTQGGWTCIEGRPRTDMEWNATPDTDYYKIYRNGIYLGSVRAPSTLYVDSSADYNTYYRYEIRSLRDPDIISNQAYQAVDITTGSCMYVSGVSGTQSANVGGPVSVTGSFIWGSGNATYNLGIFDLSNNLVQGWGGSGLPTSGSQTVTTPSGQLTAPSAGNYQICAVGNLGALTDRECLPLSVVAQPNSSIGLTVNNEVETIVNVNDSATAAWTTSNVDSCNPKSWAGPSGAGDIGFNGGYALPIGNQSVGVFDTPTGATKYTLYMTCGGSFATSETGNSFASRISPFLNFVQTAYALTNTKTVEAKVNVNALQQIILDVASSGVTGVSITGSIAGTSGVTPYRVPNVYAPDTIETNLTAPETSGGKTFSSWSGCNYVSPSTPRVCQVIVSSVSTPKTVTATYSTVVPNYPDLVVINPSVASSGLPVGSTLSFTGTTKNNGSVAAGASSVTKLKIDLYNNGSVDVTSNQSTGNLSAEAQEVENYSWVSTAVGTHSYQICADATNVVNEDANENNNCSSAQTFTVVNQEPAPVAALNVNSSGASGVTITRISGPSDIGGTTNYSRSYENNISVRLQAPATAPNNASYSSWTGCDSSSGRNCDIDVNVGENKTVTVNYSTPTGDAVLDVRTAGTLYATTVVSPTGHGGVTDYVYTSSSDISNAHLVAQLTSGSYEFTNWTGCDSTAPYSPNQCYVSATKGVTKILTANYSLPGDPPGGGWDYTLSDTNPLTIDKSSGVGQKTITRTVTSGTPDAVSTISLSGIPSGVSASIASNPCTPTCSSVVTFTVDPSTSNGTYPITVTSQPGAKTLVFNLVVTGSAMNITCVPSPATAMIGQPVTWTANVSGGSSPYTYVWSGSGVPIDPAPTVNPYSLTYSTIGQKTISVQVTDNGGGVASCPANSSVQINFNPTFEEF